MKRMVWLLILSAGLCCLLLAACTEDQGKKESPSPQPMEKAASTAEKAGDKMKQAAEQVGTAAERTAEEAGQALREAKKEIEGSLAAAEARYDPDPELGVTVYQKNCAVCHSAGVAGAPKTGDPTAWSARLAKGMETLVENSIKGIGAMPPKGGNMALSDEEVRAAVYFMVGRSR